MSANPDICEDHYTQGRPIVTAKIVIVNPETLRQATIEEDFWIDTGFDGGIHVAESHRADITLAGVNLLSGTIGVAGGRTELADRCLAYLQQIGDYELPMPGIETELILHGSARYGLLGLDILKHWIAKFDGPNEHFKITSSSAQTKK
jgi:hypothetical protein